MANKTFSEFVTDATAVTPQGADTLAVVRSGVSKQVTVQQLSGAGGIVGTALTVSDDTVGSGKQYADYQAAYDAIAAIATAAGDAASDNWYWLIIGPTNTVEEIVLDTNYVGVQIAMPGTANGITVDSSGL